MRNGAAAAGGDRKLEGVVALSSAPRGLSATGGGTVPLDTIAVIGGSLAGIRCAEALRRRGFSGRLVLVGDEPERPYDRPPLSKELLRGDREPEQIRLNKPEAFDALALDLRLGARATALDVGARIVTLGDGEMISYDGLVIATGAIARPLPGARPLAGLLTLRTLEDALALRAELERSPRVVVVGAGFIGAEVAATCRKRGLDVVLVEPLASPMARVLAPEIGAVCAAVHSDQGVDLRLGVGVAEVLGGERVERVRLSDGSEIPADVVVVGIGAIPATDWLASSGLELGDGVICDATCATRAPGVVAAGDVARWYHEGYRESLRIEHWTNAVEQADAAAARLLDGPGTPPFAPIPFVWSDQYDLKIQAAGRIAPDDEVFVAHGSLAERRFVALFGRKGVLRGALAINRVRQLMSYRRMMREEASFDAAVAAARS
jgi:NADPH-dependent 2,4-dienoyl-CoA reductase/sulfur reductase-like enzyme